MASISYQFTVPHGYDQVSAAVFSAVKKCNSSAGQTYGGEFSFKISPGFGYFGINFSLFLSETQGVTTIRILTVGHDRQDLHFRAYDKFLNALTQSGINVPVVPGEPYIVTTVQIGGGIEQQFESRQSISVGGAIVGGLLFGDLGAIIGAGGGATRGRSRTVLSNSSLFLLCYSNGMVEEKEIRKGTRLYTEAMAKLGADPIIRKR